MRRIDLLEEIDIPSPLVVESFGLKGHSDGS